MKVSLPLGKVLVRNGGAVFGTGHNEVVLVVYDPTKVSFVDLLRNFWESHDPTQGMRQGNDRGVGTPCDTPPRTPRGPQPTTRPTTGTQSGDLTASHRHRFPESVARGTVSSNPANNRRDARDRTHNSHRLFRR